MPKRARSEGLTAWRMQFGARLRGLREERDLSQEALAERAGVDRKLIYRTELGQTSPRLDAVVLIARALELPLTILFDGIQRGADTVDSSTDPTRDNPRHNDSS